MSAKTFYLQHGAGTSGPFRTESVAAYEEPRPQKRRGTVTACRFVIYWNGRRYRLFADSAWRILPHFINTKDGRVYVSGVTP